MRGTSSHGRFGRPIPKPFCLKKAQDTFSLDERSKSAMSGCHLNWIKVLGVGKSRTRRIGANPKKSDLLNFRGLDWRKFSELCVLYFFLGKTDKMLPKSRFSKPIFGHPTGSTKLDRPYCKRFWQKSGESDRPLTLIPLKKIRDTPLICIAILLQKYALFLAESSIYTTNLYHDAAPICIAILLQKY